MAKGCLERGVLINAIGERVLRLVPPLIITEVEVDRLLEVMEEVLRGL